MAGKLITKKNVIKGPRATGKQAVKQFNAGAKKTSEKVRDYGAIIGDEPFRERFDDAVAKRDVNGAKRAYYGAKNGATKGNRYAVLVDDMKPKTSKKSETMKVREAVMTPQYTKNATRKKVMDKATGDVFKASRQYKAGKK